MTYPKIIYDISLVNIIICQSLDGKIIASSSDGNKTYVITQSADVCVLQIQNCVVLRDKTSNKYIIGNIGDAIFKHNVVPLSQTTNILFDTVSKKLVACSINPSDGLITVWNCDGTTVSDNAKIYGQISWIIG